MKRLFTLLCVATLMAGAANAQSIQRYDVTNKTEFNTTMDAIATLPAGSTAYVYIKGNVDAGTLKNDASGKMQPTLRNIHFIGVNDEETGDRATLKMEMQMPADNTEADGFSLHYENLKLSQTQGVWGNSKHLMNFKDAKKHYVDTLEFVNCELTELCRSLYRGEVNGADENFNGAGLLKVFRMENCVVHNGFRQYNAMPAIYMAQSVNEMTFRNNTFYDLTYLNGLVSFGTMTENTGRQAVKVIFENNTVCAWSKSSLLGYAGGVSTESEFHIKNNIILQPTWIDDMNGRQNDTNSVHGGEDQTWTDKNGTEFECRSLTEQEVAERIEKGVVLTNLDGGLVQLENNMLFGFKYQNLDAAVEAGDIIPIGDDETEEAEFSFMTMEDIGFDWSDFVDAQNDMFQINDQHAVHSAGKNGAPLGDVNNYTDQVIKEVKVSVKVEGSETVDFTIDPVQEKYFSGNKITITLIDHNNALRKLNNFIGWNDGSMETVRQFELTEDLNLVATYEAAMSNVVSFFDFNVTPAAGQNKLAKYEADVYAEGNQAVATLMFVPSITTTDEEGNTVVTGIEENYKEADGTENRFNWRTGKFGEDDADKQISVISRKTSAVAIENKTPDFFVFTFSTKDLKGVEFSAFCGTDNFGYKTQKADWSLNGETWTNFAKVDLVSKPAAYGGTEVNGVHWGWTELKGTLPEAAENQEKVMVRIIGDVDGEFATNEYNITPEDATQMFEYAGAVIITAGNDSEGIAELSNNAKLQNAPVFNLMGIRVNGQAKGLLIKSGKKHIMK